MSHAYHNKEHIQCEEHTVNTAIITKYTLSNRCQYQETI